ncbi:hypothetical protein [Modestobacter sp. KNN46-3]|uniref:hypothetical protein n=1 Tax=Modestobacter sp. KNN46-3 TaxID=2711218 RepID=UPI0013DF3BF2|nr:hypothetical protein [Modestobacter sp. KNN46-3]
MKGLVAFVLGVVAVLLLATRGGGELTCPAIGWSNGLVVELVEGWPAADAVRIECPSPCGPVPMTPSDEEPDAVTVLAADVAALGRAELDLDWVRVGGSAECGGPLEATATVPAP